MLSRAQLAARVGVTEESIRRWELGGARPTPALLERLIVVLSLDGAALSNVPTVAEDLPPLATRLRLERAARGVTQSHAAEAIGVAQPTYAGWEIGRASPSRQFVGSIAEFLGVDPSQVLAWVDVPFRVQTDGWPSFGRLLGRRRQELRLTREELASAVGVAVGTVVAWELGYRTPRPQQLTRLAAAVALNPEALEAELPRNVHLTALGRLIRERQQSLGLRLRDVAARARVDESTLSRWMHGHHVPSTNCLLRLAAALELPISSLADAAILSA